MIAAGYLRVARARGLGSRVLPYVVAGVALLTLSAAVSMAWRALDHPYYPAAPPLTAAGSAAPAEEIGRLKLLIARIETTGTPQER